MKGLFVGRFQPFHLGHLKAIKWILERCEKVTIVIGSSQQSFTERNPFTVEERKEMVKRSLEEEGVGEDKYEIIGIPDVFDCERWVKSILNKAKFEVVFSRNSWVKECFDLFEIPVNKHPMFREYSARKIRRMMMEDEDWKCLIPNGSGKTIKNIDYKKRLKGESKEKDKSKG